MATEEDIREFSRRAFLLYRAFEMNDDAEIERLMNVGRVELTKTLACTVGLVRTLVENCEDGVEIMSGIAAAL